MGKENQQKKKELLEKVDASGRAFSDVTVLFHELVAEKAGLASADHKYLGFLMQHDSLTAGELASLSGLTTGAVTGVIDRLEKKQLVSREKDPLDRRKVVIVANKEKTFTMLGPIFQQLLERLKQVNDHFNEKELQIILRYMDETTAAMHEVISQLKNE